MIYGNSRALFVFFAIHDTIFKNIYPHNSTNKMKIVGLDIGDEWIGIAISDALGFFAKPLKTVKPKELENAITQLLETEKISKIVVGYPKTMKGGESDQTKKVLEIKAHLEHKFTQVTWALWDERLSSKRAQTLKPAKTKEEKLHSHAVAAAFILSSYLEFAKQQQTDTGAN